MFNPGDSDELDEFQKRIRMVFKKVGVPLNRRLRKCRNPRDEEIELACHFIFARAMAEHLVDEVVTDENEEFLRETIDAIKGEFRSR